MARKPKRPRDPNQLAALVVAMSVGDVPNDSPKGSETKATKARRKGGQRGGAARARSLTSDERREIAQLAARARWKKSPKLRGR